MSIVRAAQKLLQQTLLRWRQPTDRYRQTLREPSPNPFKRLRGLLRSSILFLSVFLLIITQNYWLFISPVSAATPSPLLRVSNSFSIASAVPGIPSILRIQINNDGSTALTNLSFVNNLVSSPAALIIPSTPTITNTCGGTVSFTSGTYPGTSGSITLAGGSLNNNSFCLIEVPIQGFESGNYIQSIATNTVTSNTISNLDPTSATLQVKSSSPATISKGFAPNTIPGDGRSRATITITNSNPYALSGAALSDNLPTNLTVDTRSGSIAPTTTCTGGSVGISPGNAGVSLTGATIPANGSCTMTFDATSTVGGTYPNTILATALTTTNRITNTNAATANLNVQTQISIAKAFGSTSLVEEKTTTATITITNGGNALTNATLTDDLPSPLVIANNTASTTCTSTGVSRSLTVTSGATNFSLNNANVAVDGAAKVPGSNPATNALGTCIITVNVRAGAGSIGNLIGSPPSLTVTNTIPVSALGNTEGRTNDAVATKSITIAPALVATKSYIPTAIAIGNTSRVTINVKNNSSVTATSVGYTDDLPLGLIVANPPRLTLTDCGSGTISPSISSTATSVTLAGATIMAGGICTVNFDVTTSSSVSTNLDNLIPHNTITNAQGFDSDGVTDSEGRITVVNRVVVKKVFTPNSIGRGIPSVLKITIDNNRLSSSGNPDNLTGIAITDNLPANLQVATPSNFSTTCTGSITGATSGSTSFSLSGANLNPTSSCQIILDVIEIDQSSATGGVLPRNYDNTPTAFSNNEGETPTSLPTARLTVRSPLFNSSKAFQSPSIAANGISTAVITLKNTLPIDLTNATFDDIWTQANVTVANLPNASSTCGGTVITIPGTRTVTISGATVPRQINNVAGLCTVRFDVIMDGTGNNTFDNIIPANAITTAQGFKNPTAIKGTLTRVVTAVTLLKSTSPTAIAVGQPSTLTVTLTNPANGIGLTNLGFVDNMATSTTGMVVYSVPGVTNTCGGNVSATPGATQFSLVGGILNVNSSCTVTLKVTSSETGSKTNTLPIGAISSREGVSNTAATSASISAGPGLSVSKSFLPANISLNGRSKLKIVVTNGSSSNLTAVNFTDPLPENVVVANPPNASKTCTSGTLAPSAGDTSIVFSGASLINGQTCTISVDVKSPVIGTFVNTIPVGNVTASGGLANPLPVTATLVVSNSANVLIVKRITAINNTSFTSFVEDNASTDDNNNAWPAGYLKGEMNVGNARPKDIIEYTIYFLNVGLANARGVRICDRLSPKQTYLANSYNGSTPRDSTSTGDLGMALAIGSPSPTSYLTTANDSPDRGQYLAKPTTMPINCNDGTAANANGIVVVDVTRSSDRPTIDKSTGTGTPATSYGYIRFRTTID